MPRRCPECKLAYTEKVTATKITIPEGATVCHHDVEFEGDAEAGVWYIHESKPSEETA